MFREWEIKYPESIKITNLNYGPSAQMGNHSWATWWQKLINDGASIEKNPILKKAVEAALEYGNIKAKTVEILSVEAKIKLKPYNDDFMGFLYKIDTAIVDENKDKIKMGAFVDCKIVTNEYRVIKIGETSKPKDLYIGTPKIFSSK